jgi:hypothetical protein
MGTRQSGRNKMELLPCPMPARLKINIRLPLRIPIFAEQAFIHNIEETLYLSASYNPLTSVMIRVTN